MGKGLQDAAAAKKGSKVSKKKEASKFKEALWIREDIWEPRIQGYKNWSLRISNIYKKDHGKRKPHDIMTIVNVWKNWSQISYPQGSQTDGIKREFKGAPLYKNYGNIEIL